MKKNIQYRQLVEEFCQISCCNNNLKSYKNYYQAYIKFVNEHKKNFTNLILDRWGLDVLISIDFEKYIVPTPELSLNMENKRLSKGKYEDIDTLAMSIRDTLWDMVTLYSGKDCPINPNDELRYIKLVCKNNSDKILLECAGCGWTEDTDGKEYTGSIGKVFPVNTEDIKKYNIKR